eukprot:PhF_6_TR42881/c0_g1_i1/m.64966/K05863/SLC25A4S, ANT; solute carrier family 25 (mitochondrial adenine nucleotide translocator), member 4/5/6/31
MELLVNIGYLVASKYIQQPFTRVWDIYIAQNALIAENRLEAPFPFPGLYHTARYIQQNQGYSGFFQTAGFNTVCAVLNPFLVYAHNSVLQLFISVPRSNAELFRLRVLAIFTSTLVSYPLQYLQYRASMEVPCKENNHQPRSALQIAKYTYATEGVRGFFRGSITSIVGLLFYRLTYFTLHAAFVESLPEERVFSRMLFGYLSTVVSGLVTYPVDVIRRRAMLRVGSGKAPANCYRVLVDVV